MVVELSYKVELHELTLKLDCNMVLINMGTLKLIFKHRDKFLRIKNLLYSLGIHEFKQYLGHESIIELNMDNVSKLNIFNK